MKTEKRRAMTKEKLDLLRNASLFSRLSRKELETIARYSDFLTFLDGGTVFTEGSRAEELYLIEKGAVIIRKRTEAGAEEDIARFIAGEVFGEMDLLDSLPRSASALAEGATTLLVFPQRGLPFRDIMEKHPDQFARVFQKLLGEIAGRIRAVNKLVSEKTPWIQELKKQLHRDKLTGLFNRTFLEEELQGILGRNPRTALLVVKPDNFKPINDTCGHEAGDKTLVLLADTLKSRLGEGDVGVRYRGDEFCAVLPGRGAREAVETAEGLRAAVNSLDIRGITGREMPPLTASIGVSVLPLKAGNAHTLIAQSFQKMTEARDSGGNKVRAEEGE